MPQPAAVSTKRKQEKAREDYRIPGSPMPANRRHLVDTLRLQSIEFVSKITNSRCTAILPFCHAQKPFRDRFLKGS
jgi:hypothetical protein